MTPSELLRRKHRQIREVISRYDVSNARVFGSTARGEDNEKSDLDILVDPGEGLSFYDLADLEAELGSLLGCKVDVTTPGGLSADVRKNVEHDLRPLL